MQAVNQGILPSLASPFTKDERFFTLLFFNDSDAFNGTLIPYLCATSNASPAITCIKSKLFHLTGC